MMELKEIIKGKYRHVQELFDLSSKIKHSGEKGGFREFFISELIRPLLPQQFGIGSGIIIDYRGKQSPQIDILIYDKRNLQPIFEADNKGIYPIDSVLAVLEIKTKLTSTEIKKLEKTAQCFITRGNPNLLYIITPGTLGTKDQPEAFYPSFSIFAYTSDTKKDEGARIKKHVDPESIKGYNLVGVSEKGIWQYDELKKDIIKIHYPEGEFIVKFLHLFLSQLEDIAKSRGTFGLQYWLK